MARTRTLPPLRAGEIRSHDLPQRPTNPEATGLMYSVHPAIRNGDSKKVAQTAIQQTMESVGENTTLILIAPPDRTVYLESGTAVDEVRSGSYSHEWTFQRDLDGKSDVWVIGGNLELCLGSLMVLLVQNLSKMDGDKEQITVHLPLDAIYSTLGISARQLFKYFAERADSLLEAIYALLSTDDPYTSYGLLGGAGEIAVIQPARKIPFQLSLNGTLVGELIPKDSNVTREDGDTLFTLIQPETEPRAVSINLIVDNSSSDTSWQFGAYTRLDEKLSNAQKDLPRHFTASIS